MEDVKELLDFVKDNLGYHGYGLQANNDGWYLIKDEKGETFNDYVKVAKIEDIEEFQAFVARLQD